MQLVPEHFSGGIAGNLLHELDPSGQLFVLDHPVLYVTDDSTLAKLGALFQDDVSPRNFPGGLVGNSGHGNVRNPRQLLNQVFQLGRRYLKSKKKKTIN